MQNNNVHKLCNLFHEGIRGITIMILLLAVLTLFGHCHCAAIGDNSVYVQLQSFTNVEVLIVAASIVCAVVLVIGCLDICRKDTSFKDFDNEESFSNDAVVSPPVGEFSMYPPVENTPEPVTSSQVLFEPLPDVSKLRPKVSNANVLRPRVGIYTQRPHEEVDDTGRNTQEDKNKLQNLITNTRTQLPRSQLQYIKELGNGYFGKVLQGEGQQILPGHKKTKVVIQMLAEDAESWEQLAFLQEALPYRELDHPNVLKILGQCVETSPFLMVLELCPFGDLKSYLRNHRVAMETLNEKSLLLKFASDMIAGLQVLHQHNFVHHDFATRNCLLSADLTVKIGDYGMSEESFKEDYYFDSNNDPVPIRWIAPEMISLGEGGTIAIKPITKESNIWSYGVALWEVVQFGGMPYHDLSNEHVLRLVVKERSVKLPKPELPVDHLDRLYELMKLCWHEPSYRASPRELRIMLLHLLSMKSTSTTSRTADGATDAGVSAFDKKWDQLMPRRPVQAAQPAQDSSATAGITTVSGHTNQMTQPGNNLIGGLRSSADSDLLELDVSTLNDDNTAPKSDTPVNELSLEDELSAMTQRSRVESSDSMDEFVTADMSESKEVTDLNDISDIAKQQAIDSFDSNLTIIPKDNEPSSIPDIVAISSMPRIGKEPSPDFVTSTPKKPTRDEDVDDEEGINKPNKTESDTRSPESLYTTANSLPAGQSTPNATSNTPITPQTPTTPQTPGADHADDGSLLGQRTFAAMLQTVAAPSFDTDDPEFGSFTSSAGFEKSLGDVVEDEEEVMATPYQHEDDVNTSTKDSSVVLDSAGDAKTGAEVIGKAEDKVVDTETPGDADQSLIGGNNEELLENKSDQVKDNNTVTENKVAESVTAESPSDDTEGDGAIPTVEDNSTPTDSTEGTPTGSAQSTPIHKVEDTMSDSSSDIVNV